MQSIFRIRMHKRVTRFWTALGDSHNPSLIGLRTLLLAIVKFKHDDCMRFAASLAFYSLIALVPVLAFLLGIARGFGFDTFIQQSLVSHFASHSEAIEIVIGFAQNLLQNSKSNVIAGVGILILGWSVMKVLADVEKAFNTVWGITRGRPAGRRINDYLSLIILTPLSLFLANSFTLYITNEVLMLAKDSDFIATHIRLITVFFSLAPIGMICLLMSWLYYFMPNTMVDFRSDIIGGIVAGLLFWFSQWLYISFQVGATRYDAIYGSFVALPLLFLWIYICWIIVLLGCQISFTHQSHMRQPWELNARALSHRMRVALMLKITQMCVMQVDQERRPFTGRDIANRLKLPYTYIQQMLDNLVQSDILFMFQPVDSNRIYYIPNCDIHKLTVQYVIDILETTNYLKDLRIKPKTIELIEEVHDEFERFILDHGHNAKLVDYKYDEQNNR
jgi:membrane protein